MKYPQLVSPRAVNAISDWLVSRLEQLGVESPQIYTRLLLSLLQSSVQVNDPIEFSNLEAFFANRKGGHNKRFHLPSDTETLKKLNAVQCLREIVSNEHETAAIELLVDELCEKLKDIEKRSQELNDEEGFLIDTQLNIETLSSETAGNSGSHQQRACSQQQHLCRNAHILTANDSRRILASENALKDIDNDPKKRYFRAFPALTKEMEDSFRVWRRNAKSLTWPVVGRSIVTDNSITSHSSSASSSISSSNFGSNINPDKVLENKLKEDHLEEELSKQKVRAVVDICGSSGSIVGGEVQSASAVASASSKKKSKRRRNQGLSKGKTAQNIRKITLGNNSSNSGAGGGKFYNQHHYGHHRNTSPTWDTDFKGCWEMGPDLIKEFLSRQKVSTKRSRSNSVSMDNTEHNECNIAKEVSAHEEFYPGKARPTMKRYLDISFCCDEEDRERYGREDGVDYVDEDYDDDNTFTSMPALISNTGNPRRLYQREGILQKPLVVCSVANDKNFGENPHSVEQLDFASFKAKFNSNVEALWKDVEPQTTTQGGDINSKGNGNGNGISSAFYATTSLNALAPFKHDLWNFWSNYNQGHYDPASTSSMITTCLDDSSASSGAGAGADIANSSDYFSMPSNLDDFDKSVGAVRRHNEAGASLGAHTPSINVFLQNSIWSSGDCVDAVGAAAAGENDESFLYKVWHSNKKLSQIDVGNNKDETIHTMFSDGEVSVGFNKPMEPMINSVGGTGAKLDFPPYSSLKWSEGINAGPPYNNMRSNNAVAEVGMDSFQMGDQKLPSFGSAAIVTGANWEAPVLGLNVQPDLKSWCASNPLSLTEMYGSDVCDSKTQENQVESDEMGPAVTLPNHCEATSGFVAYARIKQCGIIKPQTKPLQKQSTNAKYYFHGDEEENLLTSESTHFHPIENFVDGHSFSISSALDTVEFERSSSGYLCHESDEYMEYTRNDVYMAEEEVANSNVATTASCHTNQSKSLGAKDKGTGLKDKFVIKFRLKRSGEMACQTDEVDFQTAAAKMAGQSLPVECTEQPMFLASARQTNNETIIDAVTKAVAAAAAANVAAQRGLDAGNSSLPWVPVTTQHRQSWLEYPSLCDEVDSCINKVDTEELSQFWSMQEVEKQCHQRRLPTTTFDRVADIDRNDENSMDNTSHTLWGMCAVCNSCDYGKSMPANRMLRDELNLEADEIMSDLRYMQDLYIGEVADCCSDNADFDRGSDILKVTGCHEDKSQAKGESTAVDHVQATMLQKVNQLIEDLLRPEQTGKLMKMACENEPEEEETITEDTTMRNVWSLSNDDNVVEGNAHSWHYGNEQLTNIWQHETEVIKKIESEHDSEDRKNAFMKPMKLLRQVGGSLNEEELYMDKLNWEHEHLAKIWQQNDTSARNTPRLFQKDSSAPNSPTFVQNDYSAPNTPLFVQIDSPTPNTPLYIQNDASAPNTPNTMFIQNAEEETNESDKEINIFRKTSSNVESQEIVEKKNLKNLQCITRTPPSSNVLATANYKRVQQFLNTSAAKLKLAANRKRRHSASQNFYHQQQQLNLNSNNNNNDNITDLNRYKQKVATSAAPEQLSLAHEPKQTFITCKYWTTSTNGTQASLESAAAAMMLLAAATNSKPDGMIATPNYEDPNDDGIMLQENATGNTIPCLIDKNASILKHVAMMTRPLTR